MVTLEEATAIFQKLIDEQKEEYTLDQISLVMFDDPLYIMIARDKDGQQIFPGEVFPSIRYADGSLVLWEYPCPAG